MIDSLRDWHSDVQRRRMLHKVHDGPLHDYLEVPSADPNSEYNQVEYVALDIETTGLDPRHDDILSVGYVTVSAQGIRLASAEHYIVRSDKRVPEKSAVIHGILDDRVAQGISLAEAMESVLARLAGRVLIAHHAPIERNFLSAACKRLYGQGLKLPAVDTLVLECQRLTRLQLHTQLKDGDMRLDAVRKRHHLPRYHAHNALCDAIAAAEVFLVLSTEMARSQSLRLRQLLC